MEAALDFLRDGSAPVGPLLKSGMILPGRPGDPLQPRDGDQELRDRYRIYFSAGHYWVSRYGPDGRLEVNGIRQVEPTRLWHSDLIACGMALVRFICPEAERPQATAPIMDAAILESTLAAQLEGARSERDRANARFLESQETQRWLRNENDRLESEVRAARAANQERVQAIAQHAEEQRAWAVRESALLAKQAELEEKCTNLRAEKRQLEFGQRQATSEAERQRNWVLDQERTTTQYKEQHSKDLAALDDARVLINALQDDLGKEKSEVLRAAGAAMALRAERDELLQRLQARSAQLASAVARVEQLESRQAVGRRQATQWGELLTAHEMELSRVLLAIGCQQRWYEGSPCEGLFAALADIDGWLRQLRDRLGQLRAEMKPV